MVAIGYFVIAMIALAVIVKILSWPVKILIKLLINAVIGAVLLYVVNIAGAALFGFTVPITAVTALIAGFFGVPGVIALIIWKLLF